MVLAPVVGALLSYVLGRRAPKLAGVTASAAVLVSFLCSVLLWRAAGASGSFTATLSPWLSFGDVSLPLELYFDSLSAVMCLVVTGVGFLIHVYSAGYMAHDRSEEHTSELQSH